MCWFFSVLLQAQEIILVWLSLKPFSFLSPQVKNSSIGTGTASVGFLLIRRQVRYNDCLPSGTDHPNHAENCSPGVQWTVHAFATEKLLQQWNNWTFRLVPPCATQNDSAPESSALYPRSQEYQHCSSFGAPGTCRLVHVMCMWYIICCQVFFAACSVASLLSTVAVIISASSSSSKGPDTKIGSQNRNPNPDLKIKISIKTVEFTQRACILAGLGSVQVLKRS